MNTYEKYAKAVLKQTDMIKNTVNSNKDLEKKELSKLLKNNYKDPDGNASRKYGIKCNADGLISLRRILTMEKDPDKYAEVYERYRKNPIIFFPPNCIKFSLNCTRYKDGYQDEKNKKIWHGGFGDRIDQTLYDIYLWYTNNPRCKLKNIYDANSVWFYSFEGDTGEEKFRALIDWYGIYKIFTDKNYNIYDLGSPKKNKTINEKTDEYYDFKYPYEWDETYYNNLKEKIDEFNEQIEKKNKIN